MASRSKLTSEAQPPEVICTEGWYTMRRQEGKDRHAIWKGHCNDCISTVICCQS
jgi:hypothetical protein